MVGHTAFMNVSSRVIKEQGAANGTACLILPLQPLFTPIKNRHALQRPVF